MECAKCGISDELTPLFDVISDEGIVKLCKKCLSFENVPVIKRPTSEQINKENKSVYNRLANVAGLDGDEHRKRLLEEHNKELMKQKNITLRDIIDKKYDTFVKKSINKNQDLIENYHWVIMRARRARKMTTGQLAEKMKVSERLIKLSEQGMMPERDFEIIRKFEEYLGVRILRPEVAEELERQKKQLGFDESVAKNLTISDLQEMKKEAIVEKKTPYWRGFLSKLMGKKKKEEPGEIEFDIRREEVKQELQDRTESFNIDSPGDVPMKIEDHSLSISRDVSSKEKEKKMQEKPKKKELSEEDINDLIFGRK